MDIQLDQLVKNTETQFEEFNTRFGTLEAKLAEISKPPATPAPKAEMHDGALEGITKIEVWDIPVGKAIVGGFSAVIVSELVDGFLATQSTMVQGVVKLVAAGAAVKWLPRFLGTTGAGAMALLLAYDGIRSILPIDEWAGKVSGALSKIRTGGGLAGKAGMGGGGEVIKQAERVAGDYYSRAEGRR